MSKPGLWFCLGQLQQERNSPRLVTIVERKDAQHLIAMREALKALAVGSPTKAKIATAKRLLAHP